MPHVPHFEDCWNVKKSKFIKRTVLMIMKRLCLAPTYSTKRQGPRSAVCLRCLSPKSLSPKMVEKGKRNARIAPPGAGFRHTAWAQPQLVQRPGFWNFPCEPPGTLQLKPFPVIKRYTTHQESFQPQRTPPPGVCSVDSCWVASHPPQINANVQWTEHLCPRVSLAALPHPDLSALLNAACGPGLVQGAS
jgi:hypothetical protein